MGEFEPAFALEEHELFVPEEMADVTPEERSLAAL